MDAYSEVDIENDIMWAPSELERQQLFGEFPFARDFGEDAAEIETVSIAASESVSELTTPYEHSEANVSGEDFAARFLNKKAQLPPHRRALTDFSVPIIVGSGDEVYFKDGFRSDGNRVMVRRIRRAWKKAAKTRGWTDEEFDNLVQKIREGADGETLLRLAKFVRPGPTHHTVQESPSTTAATSSTRVVIFENSSPAVQYEKTTTSKALSSISEQSLQSSTSTSSQTEVDGPRWAQLEARCHRQSRELLKAEMDKAEFRIKIEKLEQELKRETERRIEAEVRLEGRVREVEQRRATTERLWSQTCGKMYDRLEQLSSPPESRRRLASPFREEPQSDLRLSKFRPPPGMEQFINSPPRTRQMPAPKKKLPTLQPVSPPPPPPPRREYPDWAKKATKKRNR